MKMFLHVSMGKETMTCQVRVVWGSLVVKIKAFILHLNIVWCVKGVNNVIKK